MCCVRFLRSVVRWQDTFVGPLTVDTYVFRRAGVFVLPRRVQSTEARCESVICRLNDSFVSQFGSLAFSSWRTGTFSYENG